MIAVTAADTIDLHGGIVHLNGNYMLFHIIQNTPCAASLPVHKGFDRTMQLFQTNFVDQRFEQQYDNAKMRNNGSLVRRIHGKQYIHQEFFSFGIKPAARLLKNRCKFFAHTGFRKSLDLIPQMSEHFLVIFVPQKNPCNSFIFLAEFFRSIGVDAKWDGTVVLTFQIAYLLQGVSDKICFHRHFFARHERTAAVKNNSCNAVSGPQPGHSAFKIVFGHNFKTGFQSLCAKLRSVFLIIVNQQNPDTHKWHFAVSKIVNYGSICHWA
ncbi:hypothetical protein SDC9_89703 [bioreactor metagenome]|uniref:Uncharacterized protein n=1 Tax=bioreactor metagenome TaxID=1076179 RepID=A0A644ZT09_9ZZZZ